MKGSRGEKYSEEIWEGKEASTQSRTTANVWGERE